MKSLRPLKATLAAACLILAVQPFLSTGDSTPELAVPAPGNERAQALARQPGCFVPNAGQWRHAAKFVHRSGPMTLYLQDRGWVVDLVEPFKVEGDPLMCAQPSRATGFGMHFEGDAGASRLIGEGKQPGHHNYFLGRDPSSWRTHVPRFASVRYDDVYPGIDVRMREASGVPEYDLLLEAGAELSDVCIRVEGARDISIAKDGSLVIETALGPVTQPAPKTWQVDRHGEKSEVACHFTLIDENRFGFTAPGWNGETNLTIDPGLIWSTFLGGTGNESCRVISADARGVVTVAGNTQSANFPTTTGVYDTTHNGPTTNGYDVFVSRLDPSKSGAAQLVYSTFLGGSGNDLVVALDVDDSGVITLGGETRSTNFPTTAGAYDTTHNSAADAFVARLDPRKSGSAQLVYSTFLGASGAEVVRALAVDQGGVVTMTGFTDSTTFPTTSGAYDTTHNGRFDTFIGRLDPSKAGSAQLVYATLLGGSRNDLAKALAVDANGVVTVAGETSSANLPTTAGAYDRTLALGPRSRTDGFVSQLDPSKTGSAQLVYSTFLGGSEPESLWGLTLEQSGVVTVIGESRSDNFFGTPGAFATRRNLTFFTTDAIVCRLDPSKTGAAQLLYMTFLGGPGFDRGFAVHAESSGILTVVGECGSGFPTTSGAFDTTHNGGFDCFVSRLDLKKTGSAQLVYSTYLGSDRGDHGRDLAVDGSGTAFVAGSARALFPTTSGAYNTTHNGGFSDGFVSRLDMGVTLYGDVHEISKVTGGTQTLTVNAGKAHANRLYWIFGSVTGTSPGINLLGVHIPLNPDPYTDIALVSVNTSVFTNFQGTLDANGLATALFNVPGNLSIPSSGLTLHHAYVVYNTSGTFHMASNPVPITLR